MKWKLNLSFWASLIANLVFISMFAQNYGDNAVANRVLHVRGDQYYPPYEFLNDKGEPDGFNVELFRLIAEQLGLKYEIELGPWNQIREEMEIGQIDVLLGLMVSEQRAEKMLFGLPHSVMTHGIFTRHGSGLDTLSDLKDKEIVVQQGDIMHDYLIQSGLTTKIIAVATQLEALKLINEGKHDAALLGNYQGVHLINKNGLKRVKLQSSGIQPFNYAMAVKKGDTELIWLLNAGLYHLKTTGEYDRIYQKWFSVYEEYNSTTNLTPYLIGIAAMALAAILAIFFILLLKSRVKRATMRHGESESKYRSLVETSQEAIFINHNDCIVYVNPATLQLLGAENESQVVGKSPYEFFHPDFHNMIKERINQMLHLGERVEVVDEKIVRLDGSTIDVEVAATPIVIQGERSVMVVMRDLTERLRYLTELKNRNQFIQTVLDNLPIGIALNSINDGKANYMNQRFMDIYGWPAPEMEDIAEFFHKVYPDDAYRQALMERIMADIQSGDPNRMQWSDIEVTRSDGSKRIVNAVNIPLPEQNTMVSTVMDITDLKLAEQKLKNSDRIFDHARDMLCIAGFDGYFKVLNPSWTRILGYSIEELLAKPWNDFVYPEDVEKTNQVKSTIVDGQIAFQFENRYVCKDGSIKWLSWNSFPYNEENLMIGSARDITEQKKIELDLRNSEEELQQQFEELQTLNEEIIGSNERFKLVNLELNEAIEKAEAIDRLKTAFLNNISHEVRTPLNGILGVAGLLADESTPEADKALLAELVDLNTQRLLRTINQYVDISMLSSGNVIPFYRTQVLFNWYHQLISRFVTACHQKNLMFVSLVPEELKGIECTTDYDLLAKVLEHLLENAVKFTTKGKIMTGYSMKEKEIEFFVADTGPGIDKSIQGKVFDHFIHENDNNIRIYDGNGLGLAICRHAIQLVGGRIWFNTKAGEGTEFRFALPLRTGVKIDELSKKDKPAKAIKTVLLAEDEESNYLVMALTISKIADVEVVPAVNGIEAVDMVKNRPDIGLVLMDIRMPLMDGLEATKLIKAMRPDLPVIAITAYGNSGDERRVRASGCDDYLAKPVKRAQLERMLGKYIFEGNVKK
ncbi:MAG: PAS domain S-box protein [Bacteroidales bacterium]|nr:PAS domain S-box protein [Bacteroidales bacterium]